MALNKFLGFVKEKENIEGCKGCGHPIISKQDGKKIWLSDEGYCSVCNYKKHRGELNEKR